MRTPWHAIVALCAWVAIAGFSTPQGAIPERRLLLDWSRITDRGRPVIVVTLTNGTRLPMKVSMSNCYYGAIESPNPGPFEVSIPGGAKARLRIRFGAESAVPKKGQADFEYAADFTLSDGTGGRLSHGGIEFYVVWGRPRRGKIREVIVLTGCPRAVTVRNIEVNVNGRDVLKHQAAIVVKPAGRVVLKLPSPLPVSVKNEPNLVGGESRMRPNRRWRTIGLSVG